MHSKIEDTLRVVGIVCLLHRTESISAVCALDGDSSQQQGMFVTQQTPRQTKKTKLPTSIAVTYSPRTKAWGGGGLYENMRLIGWNGSR